MITRRIFSPAVVLAFAFSTLTLATATEAAPQAHADTGAAAAPGAPMRVLPYDPEFPFGPDVSVEEATGMDMPPEAFTLACSQGPIGDVLLPDGTTQRIMVTAGHCVVGDTETGLLLGSDVYAPTRDGYERIGATGMVHFQGGAPVNPLAIPETAMTTVDWGIVVLDDDTAVDGSASSKDKANRNGSTPVTLTGVRDYRTLRPGEVSFDNFGQPICKDGMIGARKCGYQLLYTADNVWHVSLDYKHGDSGGVNFDPSTGQIIGVSSLGVGPLGTAQRADRAIELAYDVPDGQVNDYFTPAAPNQPRAEFVSMDEEDNAVDSYILENNPDVAPEDLVPPTNQEVFGMVVESAQQDAAVIGAEAQTLAAGSAVAVATGQATVPEVASAANEFATEVGTAATAYGNALSNVGFQWALEELGYE
ncbi:MULTISPECIES: hypothetical protein [Corynebacterium]|uniref:hypothetical protein n=1 Tax=Corynebacterium TaxID=1716 RepID=UPI00068068BE|nr:MULTISPECIES: hypothetical protein [Corynebacterium]MCQ4623967.1 hypothetical protein [Corynebacterium sp. CCUG 69979]MCQ4626309.1 hypothetical protein [Corynebacterium sp. CCUG 65737]